MSFPARRASIPGSAAIPGGLLEPEGAAGSDAGAPRQKVHSVYLISALKNLVEAEEASPTLNWVLNMRFVAIGIQVFKSDDTHSTTF